MHVALDARQAFAAGIGRYLRNVVPRLAAGNPGWRFTLLGDVGRLAAADWARADNVRHAACDAGHFTVREQLALRAAEPRDASVFWSPNYNVPLLGRAPLVVTIHDVMHLRLPEYRATLARRAYATGMFAAVRRRARAIMCDSDFTRRELADAAGVARGPVHVVHLGIGEEWRGAHARPPIAGRYFVFVGDLKPHKNLPVLLEAFRRARGDLDATLVLVGRTDASRTSDPALHAMLSGLRDAVRVVGEVSDAELRGWVAHAIALVQPSYYEGFGFPPLEAMAAGTPTIVARAGSLPEVCGDAALAYFDPRDADALAASLRAAAAMTPEDRKRVMARGHANVRRFDWDVTARRVRDVLAAAGGRAHAA